MKSSQTKKSILLVEDELAFSEICESLLQEQGYEIISTINGQLAIEIIKQRPIDLVLSDGRMPLADGYLLLQWIRTHKPTLPFVLMTGFMVHSDAELTQLGIDGIFEKPFDLNALIRFIGEFFEGDDKISLRKFPRVNIKLPVQLKISTFESEYQGICLNIGRGGLFVTKTPPFPELNSLVEFSIQAEPDSKISGRGIVRWRRERGDDGRLPGIGIEFSNVDARDVAKLNKLF